MISQFLVGGIGICTVCAGEIVLYESTVCHGITNIFVAFVCFLYFFGKLGGIGFQTAA